MNRTILSALWLIACLLPVTAVQAQDQAEKDLAFAQGLYRQENYQLAAEKFVAFVAAHSNHANISLALFRAGECLYRIGKYPEAQPYFERLTRQYPDSAEGTPGWLWLADTHLQAKRYAEAAAAYGTFLAKAPDDAQAGRAAYWQGEAYYQLGQTPQAIASYQVALTKKMSDQEAAYDRYALAWAYLQQGQHDKAIEFLQQVLTKYPTSPVAAECQYLLGDAQKARKSYPAALAAFQEVLTKYPTTKFAAHAQAGIGWCQFEQKAWEPAMAAFQKVGTAFPGTAPAAEAELRVADCLFHLKRFPEAAAAYDRVAAQNDSKWAPEALYWQGVACEQIPDSAKAIAAYSRLATDYQQSPRVAEGLLHVARLQLAAGKPEEAQAVYQQALAMASTPETKQQAAAGLAWARYQKDKSPQALAELERIVQQDPKSAIAGDLAYQIAWAHFAAERYEPALAMLDLLLANQPAAAAEADTLYLAAACHDKLKQDSRAEELYLKVTKLGGKGESTDLAAAKLVSLYARQGNLEQARKFAGDLQKSAATPDTRAAALSALADALTEVKQYPDALRLYLKAIETAPGSATAPLAQLGIGWAKLGAGDPTAADAFVTVTKSYPQSPAARRVPEGLFAIGEALFEKAKYPEAQAAYQRLLDACPGSDLSDEAQYKIAWSLLKQEKTQAALPYFMQAAAQASLPAVAADARFQAGRLSLESGDAGQAATVLEPFRTQYPEADNAAAALVLLGRADAELKQNEQALAVYQLVLTRYPKDLAVADAWLGLARLYRQQKAIDKALDALARCLATATGAVGAEAQFELAACYQQKGDTKRAIEEFLKVSILYPDPQWAAHATYNVGQCHEQLGDKESSIKAYKLIGRDYPTQQPWAGQAEARLKALGQ